MKVTYTADDASGASLEATVVIDVTAVNDAPVATNDTHFTLENTPLVIAYPGVLANDIDVEGDVDARAQFEFTHSKHCRQSGGDLGQPFTRSSKS